MRTFLVVSRVEEKRQDGTFTSHMENSIKDYPLCHL